MELFGEKKMNAKQVSYQLGRFIYGWSDVVVLYPSAMVLTDIFVGVTAKAVLYPTIEHVVNAAEAAALAVLSGVVALRTFYSRAGLFVERNCVLDKSTHPFEFVEKVCISDDKSLEYLLNKTGEGGFREWGSLLKNDVVNDRAVVSEILCYEDAQKQGLVKGKGFGTLDFDDKKMIESGFNGYHHYHPTLISKCFGAHNFSLSHHDIFAGKNNAINLLTFNLPEGPEVIAYNRQFVYIPTDSYKRELVKATPKDVMKYLAR